MSMSSSGHWPTDLGPRLRVAMSQAGHQVGQSLVRQAMIGMTTGPKSGRIYAHPSRGTYQASAPGEYSAVVTGDLLNSVGYRMHGSDEIAFYATSGHAGYQEYGTSKMEPRPNLAMAIQDADGEIRKLLEMIIWRALR